jgi:thioredoxin reductase (NADPH)
MPVKALIAADFEATVLANPIVLVDFEGSAKEHPDVVHAKVDTGAERELATGVGIRSVPTVMAFREGILVYSQPGAIPPAVLEDMIGQIKGLDMARVRANIAQREAAAKT